jgi:hypothetical protein
VWAVVAVGAWLNVGPAMAQQPEPDQGPTADDFFNDGVVHEVRLTINPKDWSILRATFETNTYYPCHFTWQGTTVRNIGIRSRGTGSRSGVKPGLRVDFDHYTKKQQFLGLKSFVLRNNTQDPSMLRERLAMKVFQKMGVPAPREAHARLFVNDQYSGLYTIVEAVDKVFLERHFQENDGFLYEYDYDPEDAPYYLDYRGEDPALYSPKPFKPATHEKDPDAKPIEAMIRIVNQSSENRFREEIAPYLDMTKFMTYVAIENFLAETDGFLGNWAMNNFYLYRFEKKNLSTFVPWDKSHTFTVGPEHNVWHNVDVPLSLQNRLMERAMEHPDLVDVYVNTLWQAADVASTPSPSETPPAMPAATDSPVPPQPGWLEGEVQRQYQQIRDFALIDTLKPYTNEEFEAAAQFLLFFARERPNFVRGQIEQYRGSR